MSTKRLRTPSPPREAESTPKRRRSNSTPSTASTADTVIEEEEGMGSPNNVLYMSPISISSQQASQGNKTDTTVPHSVYLDGTDKYVSSGLRKSNINVKSPLTPHSPHTRRNLRKLENHGGKKTYNRRYKSRRCKRTVKRRRRHTRRT
jgi:hypothetical protein